MTYSPDLTRFFLLPNLKTLSVRQARNTFIIEVEKKRRKFEVCRRCATPTNVAYGRKWITVKDEPFRSRQVVLRIRKQRFFCKPCKKPFTEVIDGIWPGRRTTQRLRAAISKACTRYSNLSQVRKDFRCSSSLVYKVHYEQLEVKLREYQPPWPRSVGVDEHFFSRSKGFTEFTTVFSDLTKSRLRDAVRGKDKRSVLEQVRHIEGREHVRWAVIDMSDTYRSLVRELFPRAHIVADKFHVLRLIHPLIIKERKQLAGFKQELPRRKQLLMNRERLEYWQADELDRYLRDKPKLETLYRFKERLSRFYRTKGEGRAAATLADLILTAELSGYDDLQRVGRTLKRWRSEILNYFESRLTNARTEAFNNTGKLVMKRAYGYKSFKNYRLRLLSACLY